VPSGHFAFTKCFASDCLSGLAYLHKNGICHGSIVPHNIRFSGGRAVLCNVKNIVDDLVGCVRTTTDFDDTYFAAPETSILGEVNPASDIYSLACCFLHFILVRQLQVDNQDHDVEQAQRCIPDLYNLLQQSRYKEHEDRLSAEELLQSQSPSTQTLSHLLNPNSRTGDEGTAEALPAKGRAQKSSSRTTTVL